MKAARSIAVVIPTLEEAGSVAGAVASALESAEPGPRDAGGRPGAGVDVLVVDGGSRDDTVGVARRAGARVLASARGRGCQLDRGWRATSGEIVVFLHADSILPPGWRRQVERALGDASVAGGAFRFAVDEPGLSWRLLEWGVWLRVKVLRLPYGDQALFVRRSVLEASGGIPHVDILEDLDLVRVIRRAGGLRLLPAKVVTSARRHRGGGVGRTIARHALALAGFALGVDRAWIARRVRG